MPQYSTCKCDKRVKVTRNFQVSVPTEIRKTLSIKQDD